VRKPTRTTRSSPLRSTTGHDHAIDPCRPSHDITQHHHPPPQDRPAGSQRAGRGSLKPHLAGPASGPCAMAMDPCTLWQLTPRAPWRPCAKSACRPNGTHQSDEGVSCCS
jgi:hypothetical protein